MNKNSESFNIARHQYIKGFQDKKELIFPTLGLIAKEFSLTLSTLRKKAANEGWYQKRKQYQNVKEEYGMRKQFKGKYSKLAQLSRNTLVFAEYFQNAWTKISQTSISTLQYKVSLPLAFAEKDKKETSEAASIISKFIFLNINPPIFNLV